MKTKLTISAALASLLIIPAAQAAPPGLADGAIAPLNLPGSFTPDPNTLVPMLEPSAAAEQLHASWEHMGSSGMRWVKPVLVRTNTFHGPRRGGAFDGTQASSLNWSGAAIEGTKGQYATSIASMIVEIPKVGVAMGQCQGSNVLDDTSVWLGFDGLDNGTVEQAGFSYDTWCSTAPSPIYAWIEAYPQSAISINNGNFPGHYGDVFPVSPGDVMVVWTAVNRDYKLVCATYENETANVATTACITAPGAFNADSVEWIVERDEESSGHINTLGNYRAIAMWALNAWDYSSGKFWGTAAAEPSAWGNSGNTLYYLSMNDDNGKVISKPNVRSPDMLLMNNVGSSWCVTGSSCVTQYADVPY